jgi:hypothetical protein
MTTYAPTSELEAVNIMLGVIGESPVSTLETTGIADVAIAKQVLHETSREIQSYEWDFNSEAEYELIPDTSGTIYFPPNTLKLDISTTYNSKYAPVIRGNKLYDKKNHTYTFPENIKVNIVWFLPFSDLPESVRRWVVVSAARRFNKRYYSSDTLDGFSAEDEMRARAEALSQDSWTADYNMNMNYGVAYILER